MKPLNIAVLFGGCSPEHKVSLQSAHAVLTHLDKSRFRALPIGITKDGRWLFYTGDLDRIADGTWFVDRAHCRPCAFSPDRGAGTLLVLGDPAEQLPVDAVFPVLHGKNGEDGTVQGLAELAGLPLVGCGTLASALCMDKERAHRLAAAAGVRVPKSVVFARGTAEAALSEAAGMLGYPLFVKPLRAGSSFGVSRVCGREGLHDAVRDAFLHDDTIVLEAAVPGFEVGVAVLGVGTLTTGLVDEIELSDGFFDYEEKYSLKTSRIHCPARISPAKATEIAETAKTVYRALDCRVFARVDLFLTPEGEIVFSEVNTVPGFTAHSRYPNMMRGAGLSFEALVTRLIELGVAGC